jgi:O-antigen ligase
MFIALVIHFISLYLPYQDSERTIAPVRINGVDMYGTIPERSGLEVKPYAVYVICGLFFVVATDIAEETFWRRYGYWISLVLLIVFATGGTIIRTSGGTLSLVSIALVIVAAYLNKKELRKEEAKL